MGRLLCNRRLCERGGFIHRPDRGLLLVWTDMPLATTREDGYSHDHQQQYAHATDGKQEVAPGLGR
jgi:hypothetical protein